MRAGWEMERGTVFETEKRDGELVLYPSVTMNFPLAGLGKTRKPKARELCVGFPASRWQQWA